MSHIKSIFCLILSGCLAMVSCTRFPSDRRAGVPAEYTQAWQEIYGHCYDSVPYCVVALDIYSEGLSLDKDHRMTGTGYNLYLSDIFVPDSLLAAGEYTTLPTDSTGAPRAFTMLGGRAFEDTPTGMYLLYVEEGRLQSIQLLDSGTMVVRDTTDGLTDLQMTFHYINVYGYKATYTTHFQGPLQPWQK